MKTLTGHVLSVKTAKTVTVLVESRKPHPVYQKVLVKRKKFRVHDEIGVKKGDWVKIKECRPVSKTKRWEVVGRLT